MIKYETVGITEQAKLYSIPITDNIHINNNNIFNFRNACIKDKRDPFTKGLRNLNSVLLPYTTTSIPQNPKIENNITDYVDLHLREYLQENNYNLFLSGGVDSENIANILLKCNIRFTPIIVTFSHQNKILNDYDIKYAFDFCKQHNITPTVVDIDIIDFFNTGKVMKYCRAYDCVSPQFAPILHAFEQIEGNIIYSGHHKIFTNLLHNARQESTDLETVLSNFTYKNNLLNDIDFMTKPASLWVFDKALNERNDNSISDFYNCTTDMALTLTNNMINNTDVTLDELLDYNVWEHSNGVMSHGFGQVDNTKNFRSFKKDKYNFKINHIYTPNNLFALPRTKYTGFEGIKKFYSDKYLGKDMLLQEFDKYFRETMSRSVTVFEEEASQIVNYILKEE